MMIRFILFSIPGLLMLSACAPQGSVDRVSGDIQASADQRPGLQLAALQVNDVQTAAGLATEGGSLYAADPDKTSGYDHCRRSVSLANAGQFRLAIREAQKALFLGKRSRDDDVLGYAARDLAYAYYLAGDLDKAEVWANDALRYGYMRTRNSAAILTGANMTLGGIALLKEDPQKAESYLKQARSDARALSRRPYEMIDASLAQAAILKGNYDEAARLLDQAEDGSGDRLRPFIQRSQGELDLAQGDYEAALTHFSSALDERGSDNDIYHRAWAYGGQARAKRGLDDTAGAIEAYGNALRTSEQLRSQFRSEAFKVGIFGRLQDLYDDAIALTMASGDWQAAFEISERSRARASLDLLKGKTVASNRTAAATESFGRTASFQAIRAALPAGSTLVAYHVTSDETFAWILSSSSFRAVSIPRGRDDLAQDASEFRRLLRAGDPQAAALGQTLNRDLIAPLQLASSATLVIVPHGPLHYVPFQALQDGATYLASDHAISYAPSSSILVSLRTAGTSVGDSIVALGNPDLGQSSLDLPGAQLEVEAIGRLSPNANVLVRSEASEDNFRSLAPSSAVVHVAAHAVVDELDPLYSSILLSPGQSHDGIVEAHDFYRINLDDTQMLVLSACDTGLGRVSRGDELWGFSRTILSAGTDTLVTTLWPIDDAATSKFIQSFYRAKESQSTAEAMQTAQRAALNDPELSSPRIWAAFMILGDPG